MTIEILPKLALLKISGADAAGFLQGQLTNDVRQLDVAAEGAGLPAASPAGRRWQLSGYCNPQGRLLALLYLWKQGDAFFALLDSDLMEPISKRLRMFVMRSKVSIENLDQATVLGALSEQTLVNASLTDIELDQAEPGQVLAADNISILVVNKRFLVVIHKGSQESLLKRYSAGLNWLKGDIGEGIPQVCASSSELFIPQMLNLDLLGGINFKKGCYTGQEIVARMHYLGKLKQRMFASTLLSNSGSKTPSTCQPGDKVFADPEMSKSVGNLVTVAGDQALAVLRLNNLEQTLHVDADTTLRVSAHQPYAL